MLKSDTDVVMVGKQCGCNTNEGFESVFEEVFFLDLTNINGNVFTVFFNLFFTGRDKVPETKFFGELIKGFFATKINFEPGEYFHGFSPRVYLRGGLEAGVLEEGMFFYDGHNPLSTNVKQSLPWSIRQTFL